MKGGYETVADIKDALIDALDENVELTHKLRAALTRLSALEERCGDVEGMKKAIVTGSNLMLGADGKCCDDIARAVSRWLLGKEGK